MFFKIIEVKFVVILNDSYVEILCYFRSLKEIINSRLCERLKMRIIFCIC